MGEKNKQRAIEADVIISRLPDGTTIAYPGRPGVVLHEPAHVQHAKRHTGVCDLAWSEAQQFIGDGFSPEQFRAGWPHALEPSRLGNLQFSMDGVDHRNTEATNTANSRQHWVMEALTGLCQRGRMKCEPIKHIRRDATTGKVVMQWHDFLIEPRPFLDWLVQQDLEPSRFILAWCKANGVSPTPEKASQVAEHAKKLSREKWENLSKDDRVKAWREGREPVMDVTDEDQAQADFLDGFASVAEGRGLDASDWVKYPCVTAKDAALLVCGINPAVYPDPEVNAPAGAQLPTFRKVKSAFDSVAKDGQDRTLKDWAGIAAELCPQIEIDVRVVVALRSVSGPGEGAVLVGTPVATANPEGQSEPEPLPADARRSTRRTWLDVAGTFVVRVMQSGQYSTGKEIFRALENGAGGPDSPFDKGAGQHRGSLYVREIGKPLSLKTLQNSMSKLRELASR